MKIIILLLLSVIAVTGCIKSPEGNDGTGSLTPDQVFDYSTVKAVDVSVNYRLSNYSVLVEIFDQNPMEIKTTKDGEYTYEIAEKRYDLEPVLRAITDDKGFFSGKLNLPSGADKVYIYTDYPGVIHLVEANVDQTGVNFDMSSLIAKSKAVVTRASGYTYPKGMIALDSWNQVGIPNNILPDRVSHPEGLMYDISKVVPANHFIVPNPVWNLIDKPNQQNNISVVKSTPITLVFVDENATLRNSIGYYCYPTGQAPSSASELDVVIALPNVSYTEQTNPLAGGLSSGDCLKLKYWNKQAQRFEDEFPANTTVGFVIMSNSFNSTTGSLNPSWCFYSDNQYNTSENDGARQHVIALNDNRRNLIVFTMEDIIRKGNVTDKYPGGNFRDVIFYVNGFNDGSINTGGMNVLPDTGQSAPPVEANTTTTCGTLIFEDLWPYEGDFDMNDMVVDYKCTIYRTANNRIIKLVDQFTPRHNGGKLRCGFGYQIKLNPAVIAGVNVTPSPSVGSTFVTDLRGLEREQNYPTITLFDDLSAVIGNTFTVTVTLTGTLAPNEIVPPYNPFMVISTDRGRGHELHLTNHEPTKLADFSLLGKGMDISDIAKGVYYVSKNQQFPFAIIIPTTDGKYFAVPDETVRIDKAYPNFSQWVSSKGQQAQDWYKK